MWATASVPSVDRQEGEPGVRSPVLGAIGQELARAVARPQGSVIVVSALIGLAVVVFGLAPAVIAVAPSAGYVPAIWAFGVGASLVVILVAASTAFLPPLLLRGADRAAFVVVCWLGAREGRRAFGRAYRAATVLRGPEAASRWLARTPVTDPLRPVRVEVLLAAGRLEEARAEADDLPARTPFEAFRQREALALVDDQLGHGFDEEALREAIDRIPPGIERIEASASLSVALARRAIPSADWSRPLTEVRASIPGSDLVVLCRDHGLTTFIVLLRRAVLPLVTLFVLMALLLSNGPPVAG